MFDDLSYVEEVEVSGNDQEGRAHRFLPIPAEEIAFAMSLFIGAANGELTGPLLDNTSAASLEECDQLLWVLSRSVGELREGAKRQYSFSLDVAFRTVWRHYAGDERQASACARVLGFYLLMESTAGAAVERWVSACEGTEEMVVLRPAVVETLACVPLAEDGVLCREVFLARLEARAM